MLKRDMVASAAILEGLTPGFEEGTFQPPIIERAGAHRPGRPDEFQDKVRIGRDTLSLSDAALIKCLELRTKVCHWRERDSV